MEPFTVAHFTAWASGLTLDNGEPWVLEPFQKKFMEDVFSGRPACWLVIPQGNGKTTLVAGYALYHIQHTEFASLPIAAAARDQAELITRQAAGFVMRSGLEGTFRLQPSSRQIFCDKTRSMMKIFAADANTGDGIIPTACIIDELHRHRSLDLYRTWRGKLRKRGGQVLVISTAGEPGGEFELQRERMRQMADKVERKQTFTRAASKSFALHDWSLPEDGDHDDLRLVAKANPLKSVTVASLREERESPDWNLAHWRRLTCNLPTRSELAAITEAEWFGAQVSDTIPVGVPVDVGLDLGWKYDTTAVVPLWCRDAEYRLFDQVQILEPPRDGNMLDPRLVEHALERVHLRNPIRALVMDMSNGESIANWAEAELHVEVVDRGQSNAFLVPDYEKFMEALREGWIRHTGHRDFTQHALNAIARPATFGDYRFDRPVDSRTHSLKQSQRVIDGLQAAAMVHHEASKDLTGGEIMMAFG